MNLSLRFGSKVCVAGVADTPCDAIQFAFDRDTIIVAAAGNHKTNLQFFASDSRAFSVGGYQSNAQTWDQQLALGTDSPARAPGSTLEIGTNFGANQLVVAPARDVLSPFFTNQQWQSRCRSVTTFNTSPPYDQFSPTAQVTQSIYAASSGNQYGICTGTSMVAPHIADLVGLIRSTDPLLTSAQVRSNIQHASGGVFIDNVWVWTPERTNRICQRTFRTTSDTAVCALQHIDGRLRQHRFSSNGRSNSTTAPRLPLWARQTAQAASTVTAGSGIQSPSFRGRSQALSSPLSRGRSRLTTIAQERDFAFSQRLATPPVTCCGQSADLVIAPARIFGS